MFAVAVVVMATVMVRVYRHGLQHVNRVTNYKEEVMTVVYCTYCGAMFLEHLMGCQFNYQDNSHLVNQDGGPASPTFDCPVCKEKDVRLEEIEV
jgi:hypothetical protein